MFFKIKFRINISKRNNLLPIHLSHRSPGLTRGLYGPRMMCRRGQGQRPAGRKGGEKKKRRGKPKTRDGNALLCNAEPSVRRKWPLMRSRSVQIDVPSSRNSLLPSTFVGGFDSPPRFPAPVQINPPRFLSRTFCARFVDRPHFNGP